MPPPSVELTIGVIVRGLDLDAVPVELYVMDPERYDTNRFSKVRQTLPSTKAWRLVEEFGTLISVAGAPVLDGLRFEVPRPSARATLVARQGDRVGRVRFGGGATEVVTIELDEHLIVARTAVVRAHDGRPARGQPVGVAPAKRVQEIAANPGVPPAAIPKTVEADDEGRAEVFPLTADGLAFVVLGGGIVVPASAAAPFEVTLPAMGEVIATLDRNDVAGTVTLHVGGRIVPLASAAVDATHAEAHFTGVPLGAELELRFTGEREAIARAELLGPATPGDTVRVVLAVKQRPELVLRLVDEAGVPVADTKFELRTYYHSLGMHRTDAQGRASLFVDPFELSASALGSIEVRERGARTREGRRVGETSGSKDA